MLRLTIDSLTGFSLAPLRLATWFGLIGGLAAIGLLFYALFSEFTGRTVAGWTSTVVAVSAVGAVQLLCLGVLGEYVGRMYTQMQGRPSYFVAYDSLDDDTRVPVDGAAQRERADRAPVDQALVDQTRVAETSSETPGSRSTGR
jgi:dolichol-phosphate mannosyltransferase